MKLSKELVALLKNFTTINNSIIFEKGDVLRTISNKKNVIALTTLEEPFQTKACIYDLGNLLSVLSLYEDPVVEFDDSFLTIHSEGNKKIKTTFWYADESMVVAPGKEYKNIEIEDSDIKLSFHIKAGLLQKILDFSDVLKAPDITFRRKNGGVVEVVCQDIVNPNSNIQVFELEDAKATLESFKMNVKRENILALPGDYDVTLSQKKPVIRFNSTERKLEYFIALDVKGSEW